MCACSHTATPNLHQCKESLIQCNMYPSARVHYIREDLFADVNAVSQPHSRKLLIFSTDTRGVAISITIKLVRCC